MYTVSVSSLLYFYIRCMCQLPKCIENLLYSLCLCHVHFIIRISAFYRTLGCFRLYKYQMLDLIHHTNPANTGDIISLLIKVRSQVT